MPGNGDFTRGTAVSGGFEERQGEPRLAIPRSSPAVLLLLRERWGSGCLPLARSGERLGESQARRLGAHKASLGRPTVLGFSVFRSNVVRRLYLHPPSREPEGL